MQKESGYDIRDRVLAFLGLEAFSGAVGYVSAQEIASHVPEMVGKVAANYGYGILPDLKVYEIFANNPIADPAVSGKVGAAFGVAVCLGMLCASGGIASLNNAENEDNPSQK